MVFTRSKWQVVRSLHKPTWSGPTEVKEHCCGVSLVMLAVGLVQTILWQMLVLFFTSKSDAGPNTSKRILTTAGVLSVVSGDWLRHITSIFSLKLRWNLVASAECDSSATSGRALFTFRPIICDNIDEAHVAASFQELGSVVFRVGCL